jgi:hypothetical protein
MKKKTKNLWLIKLALKIAGKKMIKNLETKSHDCKKAQYAVLMDIIDYAKDTEYGREHNFADIKSFEDFQKHVPINTYEDLKPYILKHTRGNENVLFPGKPIMYATTSGTTQEPKWIPITEKYYKDCYNGLSKLWFYSLLREHPHIFDGPEVSIVGKPVEGHTEDGTPFGSFSGHVYTNIPPLLKAVHVIPDAVNDITDYSSRYYVILRITLEHELKLIITGNPSTLIEMHNIVQNKIDALITDIEKGTLDKNLKITAEVREKIEECLKPNPARAQELTELKQKYRPLLPKHYWPTLEVINTWKCGNSGLYLQQTEGLYPENCKIREFSYLATEARAGIVLNDEQISSILAAHLLYFEFIKRDDIDKPKPRVYLASELEEGEYYYIIVTTPSGLYRYNMNDIMRCDGFYNDFPKLTFIQKGAGVTNLTGEKLSEAQLIQAIKAVEKDTGIKVRFFIGFADLQASAYRLFVEFKEQVNPGTIASFRDAVDDTLRKYNIEYESKRASNRIKPLMLHQLETEAFEKFKASCMDKGYRDGQFKLTHLMIDLDRMTMFMDLVKNKEMVVS